jgi:hypothetical protein
MTRSFARLSVFGAIASIFLAASATAQTQPLAASAAAQTQPRDDRFGFGVHGGVVPSTFKYEGNQNLFEGQTSWMVGAFGGRNRQGMFGFQGEINLVKKSTLCGCNRERVDLYYLQIPGLGRFNLGARGPGGGRFYGLAGPALEFKVAEKLGSHIIDEYSGFDVSIVAGGGFEVARFLVGLRGTWGLRNLGKDLPEGVKVTSRTFAILGGFRFN